MKMRPLVERLHGLSIPEPNSGCWLWIGSTDKSGYGRIGSGWAGVSTRLAHRAAYEIFAGPVPKGLELDHLCRNRSCINPIHLEPVTHHENMRRGARAQVTACVQGHPYDAANTYIRADGTGRGCRRCAMESQRRSRSRRDQLAAAS